MDEELKQKDNSDLSREIIDSLASLNAKIDKQDARIIALERKFSWSEPAGEKSQPIASVAQPQADNYSEAEKKYVESLHNKTESSNPASEPTPGMGLEERIGGNVFAKIGMIALVLGIAFFLKYAFDNNWINETGRVFIGIIAGLVLIGLGEKTIKKYFIYGQLLSGGGIGVLYLSIYAALNFYHLIDQAPAFVLMAFVTAAGVFLSLRYNSPGLIAFAIIGGFATPFLISNGTNQQAVLLSYVLLLDIAILFVSFFKKWRELNLIGFIGTLIVFASWAAEFYTKGQLLSTFLFLTAFFAIYSVSSLIYSVRKKERSSETEQALALLTAAAYFMAGFFLLNGEHHDIAGLFTFALALYYLIWAFFVSQAVPEDGSLYSFLIFLTIGFVTLAIPIQFDKNIITLVWIFEALILFYINLKLKLQRGVSFQLAFVVYGLVIFRLLFLDSQMEMTDPTFIFNERFFTFFAVIVISYLMAVLIYYSPAKQIEDRKVELQQAIAILIIVANFLTIYSISQEIIGSYEERITQKDMAQTQLLKQQDKNFGYQENYGSYANPATETSYQAHTKDIKELRNKRDITLSLFWLAYAIVAIVIGFAGRYKTLRIGGLLLLLLAISKLFFYDLWSLGTLYRIISSISLGVVLLSTSFAYQKYKDKLRSIIVE